MMLVNNSFCVLRISIYLGINLIDHIIVGEDKYISLKEKGVL